MNSLRHRAILGGLVWAGICIAVGAVALFSFLNSITERRFDEALEQRHVQLAVAVENSAGDFDRLTQLLSDPAYERPYSGRYWQVDDETGTVMASRSLFDATLQPTQTNTPELKFWTGSGPNGQLRGTLQEISLEDGSKWIVTAAESLSVLQADKKQIQQGLLSTFALIGVLGITGALLLTTAITRPLAKLQVDVAHRWDSEEQMEPLNYPEEVRPLVFDINALLDRNRETLGRARRQAADLAHALKTPSAILKNELELLRQRDIDVEQASQALERIDAQLLRSLARVRAENSGQSTNQFTDVSGSLSRMARLFRSMPDNASKSLSVTAPVGLSVPMDIQDLEELLGNLLENAFKWSRKSVSVTVEKNEGNSVGIAIEDDGPGIPEESRREALRSGGRLDASSPGTGLGLAIAVDLLQAYGGSLSLAKSERLGGLLVSIELPLNSAVTKD